MVDDNTIRPDEQRLVDGVELLKATEGHIEPDHVKGTLTRAHAEFLAKQGIDPVFAESLGVHSVLSRADCAHLGGVLVNWDNCPAIVFPWTSPSGRVEYQIRPDTPNPDLRGRLRKYVFPSGMTPMLWQVREPADGARILIVEGTKQGLSAATYAPEGIGVYTVAGCRAWQLDGQPIGDLQVTDGRDVVVLLDADAGTNPEVYSAGIALAEALKLESARSVQFARLPGGGKSGLDDILGGRAPDKRASYLARLIDGAKPKPADKPPVKQKPKKGIDVADEAAGRPVIVCNVDRRQLINELDETLKARWDGTELFCHGTALSRFQKGRMNPIDRDSFHDLLAETALTITRSETDHGTVDTPVWPDSNSLGAAYKRGDTYTPLERISHSPFVRDDGSIVTEPGYDEQTRTMLIPDPELAGIVIPEHPSRAEIDAARTLVMTTLLGDYAFAEDADRANALALFLTPAIRGLVSVVPLAVVDGVQMGTGKNKLADALHVIYTGRRSMPMNFVDEREELRKQITSAFRTGAELFVFDEAHTITGAPLAQALTASTWQDRILGVSTMAEFPNRVTWLSLGNNVAVQGDLTRRVYRIAIRPRGANPQDREASTFYHSGVSGYELVEWAQRNRRQLVTALLTLVRAWFADGQPKMKRAVSFGSFEQWERTVGGIVEHAGLPGFLDNLKVWRSESDFDSQYWVSHLHWLRQEFGDQPFRTIDVKGKAITAMSGHLYPGPPRLDDPTDKAYSKMIGEAYARTRGRRYENLWIEKVASAHGNVNLWRVFDSAAEPEPPADPKPIEPTPDPHPVDDVCRCSRTERVYCHANGCHGGTDVGEPVDNPPADVVLPEPKPEVVVFDLETGDADDLYRVDDGYVRLAGWSIDEDDVEISASPRAANYVTHEIKQGKVITGHNIMAFDLPALVRAGTITMPEVHELAADGRLYDTLLAARYVDPPMARDKGVDHTRRYDLGRLADTYGLPAKLTDISKPLSKKYGGWGEIPIDLDDPDSERAADAADFHRYLVGDVEASRQLHRALKARIVDGTYLEREHRIAAIAAQISINGFRVDPVLLAERIAEVEQRKSLSMAVLAGNYGVPTHNPKGVAYASPLASKTGKAAIEAALVAAGVPESSLWRTEKSGDLMLNGDHMMRLGKDFHDNPDVVAIARNVFRIIGARSVYETVGNSTMPDGRVHPKISMAQSTGRWSLTSPGLTVLGKRGGRHVERAILLPDPGEMLISADLSQVDMRAVGGLSGDQAYIQMLHTEDPHRELAIALFGDAKFRETAKAVGHGWNYGESLRRISSDNDIDPALVVQFDRSMRERFGRVVEWREQIRETAGSGQLLDNGFGRPMRPDPQRAHTQGPALMGQGCARDLMMEGLLRLPAECLPMLRAQVHDEIVLSVPIPLVEDVKRAVVEALSFVWNGVEITADTSPAGADWSKCYEKP